jgi:hypothetical protein
LNLKPYRDLKNYLKERYGEVVHRVPLDAGFSCPNRTDGHSGCIYCDPTGSGFTVDSSLDLKEQLESRMGTLRRKGVRKFMAYFQANSNTFAPVERLEAIYRQVIVEDVVVLDISTRPDLVAEEVLDLLDEFKKEIDVILELGLQSINPNTLSILNRGHTLAQFIDAVSRAKRHGLEVVAHVIANLPWDSREDVAEAARTLSVLGVNGVKIHSLYVVERTKLAEMLEEGTVELTTAEEFVERVIIFLEHLDRDVVIHRLVADPPLKGTVTGNWGLSKLKLLNMIEKKMIIEGRYQGSKALKTQNGK